MLKKLSFFMPTLFWSVSLFAGACGGPAGCNWKECAPWDRVACVIGGIIFIALLIVIYSGLLILLKAVAPKFTAKCAKSITGGTLRNFLVGLGIILAWLIAAHLYEGNEKAGGVLVMILGLLWCVKMFSGAAMCELVGAKILSLRGDKKQTDGAKKIVTGLSAIILSICTIIPGLLVLLVLCCIELGATVCVVLKIK